MARIIIKVEGLFDVVKYVKQIPYFPAEFTDNINEARVFDTEELAKAFYERAFRYSFLDLENVPKNEK